MWMDRGERMNRKEFLDGFRKHLDIIKYAVPHYLPTVEHSLIHKHCPFCWIDIHTLYSLKMTSSSSKLYTRQTKYFVNHQNENLYQQMIQIYCEVVYDSE